MTLYLLFASGTREIVDVLIWGLTAGIDWMQVNTLKSNQARQR